MTGHLSALSPSHTSSPSTPSPQPPTTPNAVPEACLPPPPPSPGGFCCEGEVPFEGWERRDEREVDGWESVFDRCMRSVVVLRVCANRPFDTDNVGYSFATGFVVDAERGLILTNRHVVGPGPNTADAVFQNHEEVNLVSLYRDPVHDFGFYRYDTSLVKYIRPVAIPLAPEKAKIGLKIRVVGNDAGEKLSILQGTLARLDRPAPFYGKGKYSDFNTFYMQAASNTSGGSSGSPVLDIEGNAIALNAGGSTKASSSFYLPLDRAKRVLQILQSALVPVDGSDGGVVLNNLLTPIAPLTPLLLSTPPTPSAVCTASITPLRLAPPTTPLHPPSSPLHSRSPPRRYEWINGSFPQIPRGTLQCIFSYRPYDEVRRLGIRTETEELFRAKYPENIGLLVVDLVVSGGPVDGLLKTGDVLVQVSGQYVSNFITLEGILDESVGKDVEFVVDCNGESVCVHVSVQDLHSITPSMFFQVSRTILHPTSYQMARHYNVRVGSVYVASPGYMLSRANVPAYSIIESVDEKAVPTLSDVIELFSSFHDGQEFVLRYHELHAPMTVHSVVCRMDRKWHEMCTFQRNDLTGYWDRCAIEITSNSPLPLQAVEVKYEDVHVDDGDEALLDVTRALVLVQFDVAVCVDGLSVPRYMGTGVVLDKAIGLVVVDRNTVPHSLGDVSLIFGGCVRINGVVVYVHPVHNFAIIKYDPASFTPDNDIREVTLNPKPLSRGENVTLIGLSSTSGHAFSTVILSTKVSMIQEIGVPIGNPPHYRATNIDSIHLDQSCECIGGVLVSRNGSVQALWANIGFPDSNNTGPTEVTEGMPVYPVVRVLEYLRKGEEPIFRALQVELSPVSIADARARGMPQQHIRDIQRTHSNRHQVLVVRYITQGSSASSVFQVGDLVFSIDQRPMCTYYEFEEATQQESVSMVIIRNGKEISFDSLKTDMLCGSRRSPIIVWAGAIFQEPHREVLVGSGQERPKAVYICRYSYGSPSDKYGVRAAAWVSEVGGKPTPTIEALREAVLSLDAEGKEFVRIQMMSRNLRPFVVTLRPDYHYWPTSELAQLDSLNWVGSELLPAGRQKDSQKE